MDWIKIKTKHHLFSDLTEKQGYALVKLQCLTAHLEAMPTEEQRTKVVHHQTLKSLDEALMKGRYSLDEVLMKVLQDVDEVVRERRLWKERKRKQRGVQKNVHRDITSKSRDREDNIREDNIREESVKRFTPPTLQEVEAYIKEMEYKTVPQKFIDHYKANGWKVGRNQMKDWKAAVRNWGLKDGKKQKPAPIAPPEQDDPNFVRFEGGKADVKKLIRNIGG